MYVVDANAVRNQFKILMNITAEGGEVKGIDLLDSLRHLMRTEFWIETDKIPEAKK